MTAGRRRANRRGRPAAVVRRSEEELRSAHRQRWDVTTRHAIMRPHTDNAVMCRQSNGRWKACYRTEAVAQRVAGLLALLDDSLVLRPYLCSERVMVERWGEHWHLMTTEG